MYSPSGHVLYQDFAIGRGHLGAAVFGRDADSHRRSLLGCGTRGEPQASHPRELWSTSTARAKAAGSSFGATVAEESWARSGCPKNRSPCPLCRRTSAKQRWWASENGNQDIWIHNLARPDKARLTFDGDADIRPTWSPSGERLAFSSLRQRDWDIFIRRADGAGGVTPLVANSLVGLVTDWSADEKFVLFRRDDPKTGPDLWYLQRNDSGNSETVPFLQTPFAERAGKFSPDGRYVAYISDESGRYEVYVEEFPRRGGKSQVSTAGGVQPRWSRDGTELFLRRRRLADCRQCNDEAEFFHPRRGDVCSSQRVCGSRPPTCQTTTCRPTDSVS